MIRLLKHVSQIALTALVVVALAVACDGKNDDTSSDPEAVSNAGSGGESDTEAADGSEACVKGVMSSSQVIMLGDSYPASGTDESGRGGIQRQIEARAVADGVLTESEHYRNYYIPGTAFLNETIQPQYQKAKEQDPDIKVVIMDGGGNDVLLGLAGCMIFDEPTSQPCQDAVNQSVEASNVLFEQMEADGITDLVFYFYPETPMAQGLSMPHSATHEPVIRENCENHEGPMTCHFVSSLAAFEGDNDYFLADGIHPNDAGQQVIGDLVWDKMVEECVAQ